MRDSMVGGFAMLAHPAEHGLTGVMSFMVSHHGVVYEKDLGKDTHSVAEKITLFDPDDTWDSVPAEEGEE